MKTSQQLPYQFIAQNGSIIGIHRLADGACFPLNADGEDAKELNEYLKNGGLVQDPAAPTATVPTVVNMCQARLALLEFGYLDDVEAAMQTDALPRTAKIYWEFSQLVRREDETVQLMQQLLNLSDARLDELFILAASK